jgi:GH24 family phage-related lysozyme (muramidase)
MEIGFGADDWLGGEKSLVELDEELADDLVDDFKNIINKGDAKYRRDTQNVMDVLKEIAEDLKMSNESADYEESETDGKPGDEESETDETTEVMESEGIHPAVRQKLMDYLKDNPDATYAEAKKYIGEKIAELMFGIKTPAQVMAEIAADSIKAVKSAGNSILGAVMHPVDTAKAAVSAVKGAAKAVGGFFSGAGAAVSKWWSGGKTENKGVTPGSAKPNTPGSAKPKTPAKVSGFDDVKAAIKAHEGEKLIPYRDGGQKWTVGVGHLIGDGSDTALAASGYQKNVAITKEQSDALFEEDFAKHVKIAQNSPGWDKANMQGKAAMIDMTYNMGAWWTKFTVAAKLLAAGNFAAAAESLRGQQKWRSQVGGRVDWVADNMAAGGGTNASLDARASTVKTASVSGGGTASAATPKAPAPKAPGAGGGQPAVASATQSNKYPAPAGAASGAAPQQQATASTRSIPSPTAPHAQEDHYAVHFNAGQSGGGNVPSFV